MHSVTFYPVGNGDTTNIKLENGKRILFDFCHRQKGEHDESPEINLSETLKKELADSKVDYVDVVAFTHADVDHISGSTDFFELRYAAKYQGNGRIKIKELWVPAAMLIEEATRDQLSNEFVLLREEAKFRLLEGKGIRVFSRPPELLDWLVPELKKKGLNSDARDHLFVDAGTLVPGFSLANDSVEFFCHAPFIKHCEGYDIIRNDAALVFNVRFQVGNETFDYLEIGDADWEVLEDIVTTTRAHGNMDRLEWNLFNIPHHCSYKGLNSEKGAKETAPKPLVAELLLLGRKHSYIVSCSKPIKDDNDAHDQSLPPHIQAKRAYETYLSKVGGRRFLVTMEEPKVESPEPLVFLIEKGGVTWQRTASVGSAYIITHKPPRAG